MSSSDSVDHENQMYYYNNAQDAGAAPVVNGTSEVEDGGGAGSFKSKDDVDIKRRSPGSSDEGSNQQGLQVSNGDSDEGPTPAKKAHVDEDTDEMSELEKLWNAVHENSNDFTAWTYLLQYVDQESDMKSAREAYDRFLSKYPYCYGYWKKYADYEKKKGTQEDCEKVFRRGLAAIPLSVDLWLHYLNYVKGSYDEDPEYVLKQFEKAVDTVGMEFRSDKLWDVYLNYVKEKNNLRYLLTVYDRLLGIPTQSYLQHYQNLQELINSQEPVELLADDEYKELSAVAKAAVEVDEENEENIEAKTLTRMKELVLDRRTVIHKNTEAQIRARWPFEEAIKRPYFHVKPLEKGQLKNWKEYLEFEISQGDEERIIVLFERCLIACALYEEYWIKFVRYLQTKKTKYISKLRDVFTRACTIHHPTKPWVNLHWSAFEESQGNLDQAADILTRLAKHIPSSLHVCFRRINLERRRKNVEACVSLFEEYIASEDNKDTTSHLRIKYARFLIKNFNDFGKAKLILQGAQAESENTKAKVLMALIDLSLDQKPVDFQTAIDCFDKALESDLPNEQKVTFAHRKIEFLEDYGSDIDSVEKAEEQLQSIAKALRDKAAGGAEQRPQEDVAKVANGAFDASYPPQATTNGQGQEYNQHGQYSNWNYQQSTGYGYNQQGWTAYGGYYG